MPGAARLPAGDGGDCLLLRGIRLLINDEPDPPVAGAHRAGRDTREREAEAVEYDVAEVPSIDAEREREGAVSLRGWSRQVRRQARAEVIAGAGFEVLAARIPIRVRHSLSLAFSGSALP